MQPGCRAVGRANPEDVGEDIDGTVVVLRRRSQSVRAISLSLYSQMANAPRQSQPWRCCRYDFQFIEDIHRAQKGGGVLTYPCTGNHQLP